MRSETPAAAAMSSTVVASYPRSAKSAAAVSAISMRVACRRRSVSGGRPRSAGIAPSPSSSLLVRARS
ncbi:hypothetical protein ACWF95_10885 [Streptomyces vinaceus]